MTGRSRSSEMGRRNPFSPEIKIGRKAGLFSCRPSRAFSAALAIVFPGRTGRAASGPIMASEGAGRPCVAWLSGLGRGVGVGVLPQSTWIRVKVIGRFGVGMLPRGFPGAAFSAWWERFTAGVPFWKNGLVPSQPEP